MLDLSFIVEILGLLVLLLGFFFGKDHPLMQIIVCIFLFVALAILASAIEPVTPKLTVSSSPDVFIDIEGHLTYVIRAGDEISQIVETYHSNFDTAIELNRIEDPNLIIVGTRIKLPLLSEKLYIDEFGKLIHVIQRGETLTQIISRYGVSQKKVMIVNEINDADVLIEGFKLIIPVSSFEP